MKNKQISIVIIIGSLVISGLMVIQITWLKRAFDSHEKEFNHTVQIAMQQVGDTLLKQVSAPRVEPVHIKHLSSKFYMAVLNSHIDPKRLDTLLRKEFSLRQINLNYEIGVYNAYDDTLLYGAYIPATVHRQVSDNGLKDSGKLPPSNFAVYFPDKTGYLAGEMKIWLFTTFILLLVIFFFVYSMVVLLREKRLSEIKEDFINNMTHEFKTPIANIELASDVLLHKKDELSPAKLARYSSIIKHENQRLKMQVDQILTTGQMHSGNLVLDKQITDIHLILKNISRSMAAKIRARKGIMRCNFSAGLSRLSVDATHLGNAFLNIVDNAEKYSAESPDITISTCDDRHGLRISITDKGMGIRNDLQKYVFDKFFRVPRGDQHDVKGFGLGLSYVKSVIEAHHGKLQLKSETGRGTSMDILLPYD